MIQLLDRGMYELIAVKLPKPGPKDKKSWFPVRRHTSTEYRAGTWEGKVPCKWGYKEGRDKPRWKWKMRREWKRELGGSLSDYQPYYLDKRLKGWVMPYLGSQQILEPKICAFHHETPDKKREKDDVGKEYWDIQHLSRKYDSQRKFSRGRSL